MTSLRSLKLKQKMGHSRETLFVWLPVVKTDLTVIKADGNDLKLDFVITIYLSGVKKKTLQSEIKFSIYLNK